MNRNDAVRLSIRANGSDGYGCPAKPLQGGDQVRTNRVLRRVVGLPRRGLFASIGVCHEPQHMGKLAEMPSRLNTVQRNDARDMTPTS